MYDFNFVDWIIITIFLLSTLAGMARGFIKEIISFISLIVAFVVAIVFSKSLALALSHSSVVQNLMEQTTNAININATQSVSYVVLGISFIILFMGTLIIGAIVGSIVNIAFQVGMLGLSNRLLGGIFGICRAFIINLVFIFVIQLTPLGTQAAWAQSKFVNQFQPAVQWLGNIVAPGLTNLKQRLEQKLQDAGTSVQGLVNTYTQ